MDILNLMTSHSYLKKLLRVCPMDEINTEGLHFKVSFLLYIHPSSHGNAWVQFCFKAVDTFSNAILI
jgi:hypothetical protein